MTLPASGQISFFDINVELGRSGTATISIDTAENGGYSVINQCSSPFPSSTNPAAITEWYSYNHNASSTLVDAGGFDYSTTSCAVACALGVDCSTVMYYNTAQTAVYTTNKCQTSAANGYYANCSRTTCYTVSGGVITGTTACTTTSTTSTTTAPPCQSNGTSCPENDGEFSPTCCSGNCCSGLCSEFAC